MTFRGQEEKNSGEQGYGEVTPPAINCDHFYTPEYARAERGFFNLKIYVTL
jgi:hypothetical protein